MSIDSTPCIEDQSTDLNGHQKTVETGHPTPPLFAGHPLRPPQAAAYEGFCRWIASPSEGPKLGHAILPGGTGKTALSVLMAERVAETGKKTLVIALTDQDADHFFREYTRHATHTENDGQAQNLVKNKQKLDPNAQFVIGTFAGQSKWPDLSEIGLIIIDEADVHALSNTNAALLTTLASEHKIPVIAVSATAELGNGRIIEDVFPDPILFMVLPESLPSLLQMGLMPEADFFDVELHARIDVGGQKDITDEAQESLINQGWIGKLLDFFEKEVVQDGVIPKTVFRFRNNQLLDELITRANARGIRLARLTGEEDAAACSTIRQKIQSGELHGVAGSRKVGRGMDIPEVEVVMGSELTKSPQLFWQGRARGFRLDPKNPNKRARVYNFVPSEVYADDKELDRGEGPLTHASFFEENYFKRNPDTGRYFEARFAPTYSLREIARVRSNREVLAAQQEFTEKPPDFVPFVEIKAQVIAAIGEVFGITLGDVMAIVKSNKRKGVKAVKPSRLAWHERLTYKEETECLKIIQENGTDKTAALQRLIRGHQPLLEAIAKVFSDNPETQEELVQEGIVHLIGAIPQYKGGTRFIRFAIQGIAGKMYTYASNGAGPFSHKNSLLTRLNRLKKNGQDWTRPEREGYLKVDSREIDQAYLISLIEQIAAGTEVDLTPPDELADTSEPVDVQAETNRAITRLMELIPIILTERQQFILNNHFGLNGTPEIERLSEISKKMSLSRERVRGIEKEALDRLRELWGYDLSSFPQE